MFGRFAAAAGCAAALPPGQVISPAPMAPVVFKKSRRFIPLILCSLHHEYFLGSAACSGPRHAPMKA